MNYKPLQIPKNEFRQPSFDDFCNKRLHLEICDESSADIGLFCRFGCSPSRCSLRKSPPLPKKFDLKAIDAYVAGHLAKGFVGLSLAIMKDGKSSLPKGYGKRSLVPAKAVEDTTPRSVWDRLPNNSRLCMHLPFGRGGKAVDQGSGREVLSQSTCAKDITILDLMNHVSGYPYYYLLDFVDRRMMKPIPFEKMVHDYAEGKLDFEPGSRFSYSNTGYILLGGIIEKVAGESFGKFLERRISNRSRWSSRGLALPRVCPVSAPGTLPSHWENPNQLIPKPMDGSTPREGCSLPLPTC